MSDELKRTLIGIDACPGGWCSCIQSGPDDLDIRFTNALGSLLEEYPDAVIAIDIPIGLPDKTTGMEPGIRQCDKEARRFLGFPRSSSVFSSPVRPLLDIEEEDIAKAHREASSVTMSISERKVTRQTMNILPRIREVDDLLQQSGQLRDRIFEVHPELIFMEINGEPIQESKRTLEGRARRMDCLHEVFGSQAVESCIAMIEETTIKVDDLMDALACCWSADRIACGIHHELPAKPEFDSTGLRMTIRF